jgi:hypothetical protein
MGRGDGDELIERGVGRGPLGSEEAIGKHFQRADKSLISVYILLF